jgi:UrcA family protein
MPRSTANPLKPRGDYTPPAAGDEAANRHGLRRDRDASPKPKENTMFRTVTTAAILVLSLALPAAAQDSLTVRYGDLDLSRPADVQLLNGRIQTAAETACANLLSKPTSRFYHEWFAKCVSRTTAQTSEKIASLSSGRNRAIASK